MSGTGNLAQVREALEPSADWRDVSSVVAGSWFGVCTEFREEGLAAHGLAAIGLVAYWPRIPKQERHGRGRMRTIWRSMFPGYVLVKCEPIAAHWSLVKCTRGVRRLLGGEQPAPIDEKAVDVVKLCEAEKVGEWRNQQAREEARERAKNNGKSGIVWDFNPKEMVRIKYGPFAGFYAELATAVDDNDRIRAFVSVFGCASRVELSAFDIERVDSESSHR